MEEGKGETKRTTALSKARLEQRRTHAGERHKTAYVLVSVTGVLPNDRQVLLTGDEGLLRLARLEPTLPVKPAV